MDEQLRSLLIKPSSSSVNVANLEDEDDEDEWSDESSNSYYSDSDSSVPEWESSIDKTTGELLYIDCHPFVTQNNSQIIPTIKDQQNPIVLEPFSKNQTQRRSTRGKFLRLIRRRESGSRRHSCRRRYQNNVKPVPLLPSSSQDQIDDDALLPPVTMNKVKFQDFQEGEEKEVILKIISGWQKGQNQSLSECLLGLNVSTLSDGSRVMIAGILPDSYAKYDKRIKIGDWLKSVNDIEVTYQCLDQVLEQFSDKKDVLLRLQRVAGIDVTKDRPINELNYQSRFVRQLINSDIESIIKENLYEIVSSSNPAALIYLDTNKLSESGPEFDDIVYCWPKPIQTNILANSRGIFITLNHLINDFTKTKTKSSSILYKTKQLLLHVIYTKFDSNLLLFMLPDTCASLHEATLINDDLIRMLDFLYESVDNAFVHQLNESRFDYFFDQFFVRLLNNGRWIVGDHFEITDQEQLLLNDRIQFEDILAVPRVLKMPSEALIQIDDALSELEASNYCEWNEEPLDCQRLFTILGSALYHYGYLLSSHFIHDDLIDIHSYCRQHGLFDLSKTEPIKTLILWREVFPYSCRRKLQGNEMKTTKIPDGRRYLLIVGTAKDLLVVIMEAGGCTEAALENMAPDAFYVEEAQATLAHLQELGLFELADRLMLSANQMAATSCDAILSTTKRTKNRTNVTTNQLLFQQQTMKVGRSVEVTSILKRRNSDQILQSSSALLLADDGGNLGLHGSQADSVSQSERSDEVLSVDETVRKSTSGTSNRYDSNDEDSDPDDYAEGSQISNSSFDISELRQTLLSETATEEWFQPRQLTSGIDNVLLYFIQLDLNESILCPPEFNFKSHTFDRILTNFRRSCHKIHLLFQNTLRFKNMPAQDMAKSVMNKSLIAIKEYGVMFECPFIDDIDNSKKNNNSIKYWVIGRIFHIPCPREVYVCYQDTIPQNIIELAFKIMMFNDL